MLEQKGLGFEPEYERTNITDELHNIFNFNTDSLCPSLLGVRNYNQNKLH